MPRKSTAAHPIASVPRSHYPPVPGGIIGSGRLSQAITSLIDEPEVRLLMKADRVAEDTLVTILDAASNMMATGARAATQRRRAHNSYRPGVGIMLLNEHGQIFAGRRGDVPGAAWQMPQGGIERGETPRDAVLRELEEEIGTRKVTLIAESRQWFSYDVPYPLAQKAWQGRWRGQRQKWFAGLFRGEDRDIHLTRHTPEFSDWRWVTIKELSTLPVSFKGPLYLDVIREFSGLLGNFYRKKIAASAHEDVAGPAHPRRN